MMDHNTLLRLGMQEILKTPKHKIVKFSRSIDDYLIPKKNSRRSESNLDVSSAPVFDAEEIVQHLADATSLEVRGDLYLHGSW